MRTIATWAAAAAAGAAVQTGCSDGDPVDGVDTSASGAADESDCESVADFPSLLAGRGASETFDTFAETTERLAETASVEIADQRDRVREAVSRLSDEPAKAGISVDDLTTFELTPEQEERPAAIQGDVLTLGQEVDAAGTAITEHARERAGST
ncbi:MULTISPECIES: hypothetical protein [unclassified Nocardioides]|uniref:hypothetical protein n=1 Tax=unclassified Nocardioides TaxID=2615069 RepID=UPI003014E45A